MSVDLLSSYVSVYYLQICSLFEESMTFTSEIICKCPKTPACYDSLYFCKCQRFKQHNNI